jgi:hypothetical protein
MVLVSPNHVGIPTYHLGKLGLGKFAIDSPLSEMVFREAHMTIYSRVGLMIYKAKIPPQSWDGLCSLKRGRPSGEVGKSLDEPTNPRNPFTQKGFINYLSSSQY